VANDKNFKVKQGIDAGGTVTATGGAFSSSVEANNFNVVGGAFIARNPGNTAGSLWLATNASGTTSADRVVIAGGTSAYSYHDANGIDIRQGGLASNGTLVLDINRNLTNIGNISSSGRVKTTDGLFQADEGNQHLRQYEIGSGAGTQSFLLGKIKSSNSTDGGVTGTVKAAYDYGDQVTNVNIHFTFAQRSGTQRGHWWYENTDDDTSTDVISVQLIDDGLNNYYVWLYVGDYANCFVETIWRQVSAADITDSGSLTADTITAGTTLFDTANDPTSEHHIGKLYAHDTITVPSVVITTGGNSSNWNTAYTYSQVGHLPLTGGTLTGNLSIYTTSPDLLLRNTNTALTAGQDISTIQFRSSNVTAWTDTGSIRSVAVADWSSSVAADMVFSIHSGTGIEEKLRLTSDGVSINGTISATDYNDTNWNTAYTYSQVGHVPLAGGTMTGKLTLNDAGYSLGDEYHKWKRAYTVSTSSPQEILYSDGNSLPTGGVYRFTAHISATGTDQFATAVYWNQNGTWRINVTGQSGTSSNHPEFIIDATTNKPTIHIDHASAYGIHILGERIELTEGTGTDNAGFAFGTDAFLGSVNDNLYFLPGGTTATGPNSYDDGNVVWHTGNLTTTNKSNYDTAYGWGDHSTAGYLTSQYTLPVATDTTLGGIELFSDTDQTVVANAVTTTTGRTYGVQLNADNQAVVNVPWSDTDTNTTYSAGTGLTLTGTTFSVNSTSYTNWNTAYTYSQVDHLPLTGGTLTGNLGIYTTSAKLLLRNTNTALTAGQDISTLQFRCSNVTAWSDTGSIRSVAVTDWSTSVAADMVFSIHSGTSIEERLRLTSEGVSITGPINPTITLKNTDTSIELLQTIASIEFRGDDDNTNILTGSIRSVASAEWGTGNYGGDMSFSIKNAGSGGTFNEKLRLTNTGAKIEGYLSLKSSGSYLSTGPGVDQNISVGAGSTGSVFFYSGASSIGSISSSGLFASSFGDKDDTAYYLDPSNDTTSLVVKGNVGIGTDSPATKLEVEGNSGAATGTVSAPVAIRITDTSDIGVGGDITNPYAALQFFGRDTSNEGPIVQAQISTIYDDEFGAGSHLTFSTWNAGNPSAAERMRIDSAGNVGIGTSGAGTGSLTVAGTISATDYNDTNWNTAYTYSQVGHLPLTGGTLSGNLSIYTTSPDLLLRNTNTALTAGQDISTIQFRSSNVTAWTDTGSIRSVAVADWSSSVAADMVFSIHTGTGIEERLRLTSDGVSATGNFIASGNVTAYSDIKLKEDIKPIENAISKVQKLRGVTYTRNDLKDTELRHAGLIAQEVELVLPEAVSETFEDIKVVNYNATIALLVEAVKELKAEIEHLKEGRP